MKAFTVSYNYNADKTTISPLGVEFEELPIIHQLDSLKDAIIELSNIYDNKLIEFLDQAKK